MESTPTVAASPGDPSEPESARPSSLAGAALWVIGHRADDVAPSPSANAQPRRLSASSRERMAGPLMPPGPSLSAAPTVPLPAMSCTARGFHVKMAMRGTDRKSLWRRNGGEGRGRGARGKPSCFGEGSACWVAPTFAKKQEQTAMFNRIELARRRQNKNAARWTFVDPACLRKGVLRGTRSSTPE